jgi:hypothetical protein
MKKTLLIGLTMASIIGLGVLLIQPVLASETVNGFGRGFQKMIEIKAEILGMDGEELQTQLQTKNFAQIAEEEGIGLDQLHEQVKGKSRERWEEMGFSQEEIAERERQREERHADCDGTGMMGGFGGQGFGKNR